MRRKLINVNQLLSNQITIILFLIIINFLAHFLLLETFGLYEDDHFRVPQAMEMNWQQILDLIGNNLLRPEYTQGRPLHIIFIYLFSYLGTKFASLNGVYFFGFIITNLNIILFYFLLLRISQNNFISLTGGLFFILFPADTTRIWLTSLFGLQTSLTFLLISFHLYISKNVFISYLSYVVIIFSLITYETPFFIFLTAPILSNNFRKKNYFKIFQHSIFLSIILFLITLWRSLNGESRVVNLNINESIRKAFFNMFVGTGVSIKSVFDASFQSFTSINNMVIIIVLMFMTFACFLLLKRNYQKTTETIFKTDLKLMTIGLIMLVLAYPLTLNLSATEIHGTWSRIHLSSTVGFAFFWAGLSYFLFNLTPKSRLISFSSTFFISLLFSLLLSYKIFIQQDYALNWQHQREFWQEITPLISDIEEGDLIFFDRENINISTQEMRSNHWSTAPILNNLYHFPPDWKYIPQVYLLAHNWQENLIAGDNLFLLSPTTLEGSDALLPLRNFDSTISSQKVIFIKSIDGKLTRVKSPLIINSKEFDLKNHSGVENNFPKRYISKLMLE